MRSFGGGHCWVFSFPYCICYRFIYHGSDFERSSKLDGGGYLGLVTVVETTEVLSRNFAGKFWAR